MTVALPALVLFFLVLPGFVFRSRFKRAERTALDYAPFGRVVAEAVLWAAVLHAIWLGTAWILTGRTLRLDLLLELLSAAPNAQAAAIATVGQQSSAVLLYFGSLLAACYLVPAGLRWLITSQRLDRAGHWLAPIARFHDAPWYYLLTGADFRKEDLPDLIKVSAIVDVASTPYLFTGFLENFYFNPDGGLDRLVLQGVARRPLANDRLAVTEDGTLAADEEFYPIEGDYFVLRYAEIITLNIQYLTLEETAT
ncbi:conserved membrane hypothetical protein [Burkholderiales bacterium 8X]|nr:conserved membrane hypothetical protein [Burkholderiales bacterium 8X]